MRVCLDTNVFVQIFTARSPFVEILEALVHGRLHLLVSNEILCEYEEIITNELGAEQWQRVERLIETLQQLHGNVLEIEPHYRFGVVKLDPDDNKFTDCAIAGGAEFVITYDRHFTSLLGSGYRPQPLTPEKLTEMFGRGSS